MAEAYYSRASSFFLSQHLSQTLFSIFLQQLVLGFSVSFANPEDLEASLFFVFTSAMRNSFFNQLYSSPLLPSFPTPITPPTFSDLLKSQPQPPHPFLLLLLHALSDTRVVIGNHLQRQRTAQQGNFSMLAQSFLGMTLKLPVLDKGYEE